MNRKNIGQAIMPALVITNIALWIFFGPSDDGAHSNFGRQMAGEIIGSTAIVVLANALFLSTRLRFLEPYFGGLDQVYQAHKRAGMLSIFLLILHFFTVPLNAGKMKVPGDPMGIVAFAGLLLLVLVTIAPRIPLIGRFTRFAYDKWKRGHALIGVFFLIGFAHAMNVDPLIKKAPVPFFYLLAFFLLGITSYLYSVFLRKAATKRHGYVSEGVSRLNGTTLQVALKPQSGRLDFRAGQFIFVQFEANPLLSEAHPFTVASAPNEETMRLVVKASGDWTQHLYDNLKPGDLAKLEGAYGMFDFKMGGKQQIWIAGGIGLTPFLSWIREGQFGDREIDFFYCVRSPEDALFFSELEQAAGTRNNFRMSFRCTNEEGHLSVDKVISASGSVTGKDVYICGPIGMTNSLQQAFQKAGVPASQIHFEEFNFR